MEAESFVHVINIHVTTQQHLHLLTVEEYKRRKHDDYQKKSTLIIIILAILICISLFTALFFYLKARNETYDDLTTAEQDLLIITESYPTQFIVYGDEIDFDSSIDVTYIDSISEEKFTIPSEYRYQLIIINDLDNSLELSINDWQLLSELTKSEKKRNLFYLGNKEFEIIKSLEITDEITAFEDGDLSIGFVHEDDLLITVYGTYIENADYSLTEVLLHEQAYGIKMSNS